jgi:hypothetical protein
VGNSGARITTSLRTEAKMAVTCVGRAVNTAFTSSVVAPPSRLNSNFDSAAAAAELVSTTLLADMKSDWISTASK